MPLNITWDQPHPASSSHIIFPPEPAMTTTSPRKLEKRVSFAASIKSTTSGKTDFTDISDSHNSPYTPKDGDEGDGAGEKKEWNVWTRKGKDKEPEPAHAHEPPGSPTSPSSKSGWLSRFDSTKSKKGRPLPHPGIDPDLNHPFLPLPDPTSHNHNPPSPTAPEPTPTWHHHDRYFPAFSDSDITSLSPPPPKPAASLYTFTSPFENALTPMEIQAKEHSTLVGRNVVIHYPDLPAFKDYLQGKTPEAIGWQTSKWGTEGWTGYGWAGDMLPDKDGKTFGVAMPEGRLPPKPDAKKKKGKGEGWEGEEGEEGGEGEEEGEAAGGGGGGGGGGGEGGGGGGGKKKKKK